MFTVCEKFAFNYAIASALAYNSMLCCMIY